MRPVCLTDRWPSTHTSMRPRSYKIMNVLRKLHTCMQTHACTRVHGDTRHLTSHEAHGKSHALSLIHANTCSGSQMHSHTYSWSHTVHIAAPLHAHWCSATDFLSLLRTYSRKSHTHTSFSWHASLHCTFNPETSLSLSLHSAINFPVLLGVRHVQQLTGDETICNSMPCFCRQIKLW